jgi:hypothetical protein
MGVRDLAFLGVIAGGVGLMASLARVPELRLLNVASREKPGSHQPGDVDEIVSNVDAEFEKEWREAGLSPAARAPDLVVMRRLALALMGTVPSLEEIRRFEATTAESRIDAWVDTLLSDRRTADYLAERLARVYVGTEGGPFILFRRRRFTAWLSDALYENRPYDEIVRDLISDGGLWTDHPATNFVTVTFDQERGRPDPERLAARVSRAFLGMRIDCAQCHDHPFAPWKQSDFRGLAAFFGSVHSDLRGIREGQFDYAPLDPSTHAPMAIEAGVPFQGELLPGEGDARARLASWVVDAKNSHLARATVNRVWALMLGRPLHEPVDDLPADSEQPEVLKQLAADFAAHGFDLHRLIRVIARSASLRLDSAGEAEVVSAVQPEDLWARFPLTRLRPEQVAGAVSQASSLTTIGPKSFWLVRLEALTSRNDFVRRYGDLGEDELEDRSGTLTQRLLLMNGDLVREKTKDDLFSAVSRIAKQSPDDAEAVTVAYLVVLTRRPTPEELAHFAEKLRGLKGGERTNRLSDLFWTLMNTTEFSWNH